MPVIRDVMSKRVVKFSVDTTLSAAARILCQNDISGAPVVAEGGKLAGVIAELGMVDVLFDEDARQLPISECMTRDVHVVSPEASLAEAARLLVLYEIRRLPVVEEGELVGIVTRRDLMNYVLQTGEVLSDPLVELIPALAPMA